MMIARPRSAWGGSFLHAAARLPVPSPLVIVHHSAGHEPDDGDAIPGEPEDIAAEAAAVASIDRAHRDRGYANGIGYSFAIGPSGTAWTGRGWGVQGGHTYGRNDVHGIVFLGTFVGHLPTEAALRTFVALVQEGIHLGHLTADVALQSHRQAALPGRGTACCGRTLEAHLPVLAARIAAPAPPSKEAPLPEYLLVAPPALGGYVLARYPSGRLEWMGPDEYAHVKARVAHVPLNDKAELARRLVDAGHPAEAEKVGR